jgi:hypothetical protein
MLQKPLGHENHQTRQRQLIWGAVWQGNSKTSLQRGVAPRGELTSVRSHSGHRIREALNASSSSPRPQGVLQAPRGSWLQRTNFLENVMFYW